MARFEGSISEYHHFIGPRIRNMINLLARKERRAREGVCEECGQAGCELQSAHVHERNRRKLVEQVLLRYVVDDEGRVSCDIAQAEREIQELHLPVADTFRFLCAACHLAYDHPETSRGSVELVVAPGTERVGLVFMPAGDTAFKKALLCRRKAYGRIFKRDGTFEDVIWNADSFRETSNLRGNIFSGYLRNWRERGIVRAVFAVNQSDLATSAQDA
ncbi:MAG: hypothetical protein GC185_11795 [Alphaproteobacteria bacterium]|nr:hypothetical protein [Alphaproteobacteria bacterium]